MPDHGGTAQADGVKIRPIDATAEADFAAWYDVYIEAFLHDYPGGPKWQLHEAQVAAEGHVDNAVHLWLAEDDSGAVGAGRLGLPLRDNLRLGEPEIYVRSTARRQGIGTALLREVESTARENGRSSLMTYVEGPDGVDATPGTAFAEQHGFTRRIVEIARAQRPPFDLDGIVSAEEAALPHAEGYRLVSWVDDVPDDLIDEYARLEARLSTDAPLGELDYEPEIWDAERVRRSEARRRRMRRRIWSTAAIGPDGVTMTALTDLALSLDSDESGFQGTTIVDPEHRGHRLGLLVKATNFKALHRERPDVQGIWTWNADSNSHMISINETIGYRVVGWSAGYQRDL